MNAMRGGAGGAGGRPWRMWHAVLSEPAVCAAWPRRALDRVGLTGKAAVRTAELVAW